MDFSGYNNEDEMLDFLIATHSQYQDEFVGPKGEDILELFYSEKADIVGYYYSRLATANNGLKGTRAASFGVLFVMVGAINWTNHGSLLAEFVTRVVESVDDDFAAFHMLFACGIGSVLTNPVSW